MTPVEAAPARAGRYRGDKLARSLAIVGGGPSGLASAKAALELGLRPTLFEREPVLGGLWWPPAGATWPGMSTNLSRYTCAFSDHPWPCGAPDFPRQPDVLHYLQRYSDAFSLHPHIRLAATVTRLDRTGRGWSVAWREAGSGRRHVDAFDAAIVASGFFSRPFVPPLPGIAGYRGRALHSSQYRAADEFLDRRVTVVGQAFSGAEIAAELALAGVEVTAVASRPMWLLPRLLAPAGGGAPVPLDLLLHRRSSSSPPAASPAAANRRRNRRFDGLGANPGLLDPALRLDPDSGDALPAVICDRLADHVASGRLGLRLGRAVRLDRGAVVLNNGPSVRSDAVIWCTGYRLALPFVERRDLDLMSFDAADSLQPLLLHKCTFHPDLPDLAFVGVYRGPYFAVIELQARWSCAVLGGYRPQPARQAMLAGLAEERRVRDRRPRPQFPHPDYVELADSLAVEIDALPDLDPAGDHHDWLSRGPVVPAHYRLRGPFSKPALALREIESAVRRAGQ